MAQQPSRHVQEWIKQQHAEAEDASRKLRKAKPKPRSSLEDALRHEPATQAWVPEQIPLPESSDGTSMSSSIAEGSRGYEDRDGNTARDSLHMVDRHGTLIPAASVPLPESRTPSPAGRRLSQQVVTRPRQRPQWQSQSQSQSYQPYDRVLARAADVFDHIKNGNIRAEPRLRNTSITLYEYYGDGLVTRVGLEGPESVSDFRDVSEGLRRRVFLIEDLSVRAIHCFGETFGITPEFFEEHLLNSGWSGAKYNDPPAQSWTTARLPKSYTSIQWFRPVYRRLPIFSRRDREDLLDVDNDGLEYTSGGSPINIRAETNIFRSEWDLRINPRGTMDDMGEFGLVERTSIWRKFDKNRGYEIVQESDAGTDDGYIVSDDDDDDHDNGNMDGTTTQPIIIIDGDDTVERLEIPIENPRRETERRPVLSWLHRRRKRKVSEKTINVMTSLQVLVKQMAPRKSITIDLEEAFFADDASNVSTLQKELTETRSTRQEFAEIMDRQGMEASLLDMLFGIIRKDTSTLLQVLGQILSDMDNDLLDDTKMEDRLALWRQLIKRAEKELTELKTSTKSFLFYFGITHIPDTPSITVDDDDISSGVSDLFQEIDKMLERLRRGSTALTSNMGLLDSRRSIDEAHAVTRLTELAFLFIPLSFSTSIFGMQIKPFEDSVPLWNFLVVAISVTTFAYLMRLTMRSQWLSSVKQSVKLDVRRYAEQHSLPVQARSLSMLLLLLWSGSVVKRSSKFTSVWITRHSRRAGVRLWKVVGFPISLVTLVGLVAVVPLSVLWTRNLDHGVQTTVTVPILIAIVVLVGIPYWRNSKPEFRNAFPELIVGLLKRIPRTTRFLLLGGLGFAALFIVPLALIWTRPLATGVKAGLTTAIVIILLLGAGILSMGLVFSRNSHFARGSVTYETDRSSEPYLDPS
ncbi:hypothetical protein P168DRAFT_305978 [Aspergillus campestris IBT 28561]|uniref:Uncharacterized protein n=1 Tax=Aspergillus campestris (strain IBT 28561) TaxID=1392248 RepID=A0A2I1CYN1_ASPC2|nr:uncharacterized protein P168DRAFT_305978 [Aspergillus campestris IBT 28561]PKY02726.1 hypothetical protein P168DRAFT_305978 [Aspergillus campestris IBT 28561]